MISWQHPSRCSDSAGRAQHSQGVRGTPNMECATINSSFVVCVPVLQHSMWIAKSRTDFDRGSELFSLFSVDLEGTVCRIWFWPRSQERISRGYVSGCRHLLNDGITRAIVEHHCWAVGNVSYHGFRCVGYVATGGVHHRCGALRTRLGAEDGMAILFLFAFDDANVISKPAPDYCGEGYTSLLVCSWKIRKHCSSRRVGQISLRDLGVQFRGTLFTELQPQAPRVTIPSTTLSPCSWPLFTMSRDNRCGLRGSGVGSCL